MKKCFRSFIVILIMVCVFGSVAPGAGKTLYWSDFTVAAELEKDGTLHIREQQTIVFNGDWNGGERRFAVAPGQEFRFNGLSRLGSDGEPVVLQRGDLAKVDKFNWAGGYSLRWRSRLPGDPPFSNHAITYILDYSMSNILLQEEDGRYRLSHDFAFADRSGTIEKFRLELSLASNWQGDDFPLLIEKTLLAQGTGVVVTRRLTHFGDEKVKVFDQRIAAAGGEVSPTKPAPHWLAMVGAGLLVVLLLFCSSSFFRHERSRNRFAQLPELESIDAEWLENNIFQLLPETVGAAWDRRTSGYEVAAVLARLVLENKIKSRLEQIVIPFFGRKIPGKFNLHLELLQTREKFSGYERKLIDGFFIDGEKTDSMTIKAYYRKKNTIFLPVKIIREPVQKRVKQLTAALKDPTQYQWLWIVIGLAAALLLLVGNGCVNQGEMPLTFNGGFFGIIALAAARGVGDGYRRRADKLGIWLILVHLIPVLAVVVFIGLGVFGISTLLSLGLLVLCGTEIFTALYCAKTHDSIDGTELSRKLTAARYYFMQELAKPRPSIKDEWFPYLLAFGLGPHVDIWSKTMSQDVDDRSIGSGRISGGTTFTGGGGRFGGGGAGGAWAATASALGAGAGSSSSSSGGGGGSSGGGGGGGW